MMVCCVIYIDFYLWVLLMIVEFKKKSLKIILKINVNLP